MEKCVIDLGQAIRHAKEQLGYEREAEPIAKGRTKEWSVDDAATRAEEVALQTEPLLFDVYKTRILDPSSNTMEMLTYLDQMTAARARSRGNG